MNRLKIQISIIAAFFFFLSQKYILYSQTVSPFAQIEQFSHTLATEHGEIRIDWPPLFPGDEFTGRIHLMPKGKKTKQIRQNEQALQSYTLHWGQQTIPVQRGVHRLLRVPDHPHAEMVLYLRDKRGRAIAQKPVPILEANTPLPAFPGYLVSGGKIPLAGSFDGLIQNSIVRFGNQPAQILAESSHFIFIEVPEVASGKQEVQLVDADKRSSFTSQVLALSITADKLQLRHGERTQLSISVSGLRNIEKPLPLLVKNLSPENISMTGGNQQNISIQPKQMKGDVFRKTIILTALKAGSFSVQAQIPPYSEPPTPEEELCSCWLRGHFRLLSPDVCQELGGTCQTAPGPADDFQLPPRPGISLEIPDEFPSGQKTIPMRSSSDYELKMVHGEVRPVLSDQWIPTEIIRSGIEGMYTIIWPPSLPTEGYYLIRILVVDDHEEPQEIKRIVKINPGLDRVSASHLSYVSSAEIRREERAAEVLEGKIERARKEVETLKKKQYDSWEKKQAHEAIFEELVAIDQSLDRVPFVIGPDLEKIIDSLERLKQDNPNVVDTAALKKAVNQAHNRLEDCQKHLEALRNQKAKIQEEQKRNKEKTDQQLEVLHQLMTDNGMTGGYGYHDDGRYWYGYVGGSRANGDLIYEEEYNKLKKTLRGLRKDFLKNKERLKNLDEDIAQAERDCADLSEQVRAAEQALANGEQYQSMAVSAAEKCRQIHSLLGLLRDWCQGHPNHCNFGELLAELLKNCPKTPGELRVFFSEFDRLLQQKKALEEKHRSAAETADDELKDAYDDIAGLEDEIRELEDDRWDHIRKAERLRRERAQALEAERKRQEQLERERQKANNSAPKPQPILEDPVDPQDDQLKWGAKLVIDPLYRDHLVKGPCDCITKALGLSKKTNSIASDLVGRIGVGVAFAPLEAFPGIKIGGRLAIGAIKALASAWVGGEKLSDELIKNLFNAIGGELFPKLLGNKFLGNRLNYLAGKGIEEILKAEGVRTISWSGETNLAECGPVKGTSTLLVNPNTGWVVITIKIENCPIVVVKYKINKDGIAISKPIVQEIES